MSSKSSKKKTFNFRPLLIISTVFLIIVCLFLLIRLINLEKDLSKLSTEHSNLIDNYETKIKEYNILENNYSVLSSEYNFLLEEYTELFNEYENLIVEYSEEFLTFQQEINNYIEVIEDRMSQFRDNSIITNTRVQRDLRTCIECSSSQCIIKVACIKEYVNSDKLELSYGLTYKDILQDIDSFIETKEGDCKEFSLIFTAQLRYLIDYSNNQGKTPIIESIIFKEGATNYPIYGRWVYPNNIDGYRFPNKYNHPYIVCGEIYDPNQQEIGNHCLIAVADKKINNVSNISYLDGAHLLEPQNGFFIDNIQYKDGIFYGDENPETKIHVVIIEDDIFLNDRFVYNEDSYRWHNYKEFHDELLDYLEEN